jgi:hypothetical protein
MLQAYFMMLVHMYVWFACNLYTQICVYAYYYHAYCAHACMCTCIYHAHACVCARICYCLSMFKCMSVSITCLNFSYSRDSRQSRRSTLVFYVNTIMYSVFMIDHHLYTCMCTRICACMSRMCSHGVHAFNLSNDSMR